MVFAAVAGLQAVLFLAMLNLSGGVALLVAVAFMLVVFGQVPINDVLIGRIAKSEWRSRAYAIRYVLSFAVMATTIPTIAAVHATWGFHALFLIMAAGASLIFLAVMQKDYVATGSDGAGPPLGIGNVHSRSYTTFLNKIKKYAQERKAISVAHAVRSQTSLPAQIMNLSDRGWIKEGYAADIAVIDLENIQTQSDISQPHEYSEGVEYLLINGDVVIDKGEFTGKLPGKVLKLKESGT